MWKVIGGFIGGNWRFLLGVSVAVGLTWIVATCQNRGDLIVTLKSKISRLDSLISYKNDTIRTQADIISGLQADSTRLKAAIAKKSKENSDLRGQLSAGELAAAQKDNRIEEGNRKVDALASKLSNAQLKAAADQALKDQDLAFSGPGAGVDQREVNDRLFRATGRVKVLEDSTKVLYKVIGQKDEKIRQQGEQIVDLTTQVSELEDNLNGKIVRVQTAFAESKAEKHFLGVGQKKSKDRLEKKVIDAITPSYKKK